MKEKQTKERSRAGIDPALTARAKAGDPAAFTELYEQTHAGLYRSIRAMVRDEDLAWDILQDSYLRAWRGLDKLESGEAFWPWLRRIAVNVTATEMAKKLPMTFTDLSGDEDDGAFELPDMSVAVQPELALDRQETSRLVRQILAELPEAQQLIVGMHYYEDMPVREIAETLQIAPGTVKAQLFNGRKKSEAGVRALEKQGVKLYGLSPLPFLLALLRKLEPGKAAEQKALAAVLAEAPAAGGSATVAVTAMTAGQAFLHGLGAKLLAGTLTLAVLVGGVKLAYDAMTKRGGPPAGPERPTIAETAAPSEISESLEITEAQEPVDHAVIPANACGPNLTWSFDADTGTLTIEGSGDMYDYDDGLAGNPEAPWASFRDQITALRLPADITSIGARAFYYCDSLTGISIPESVRSIGNMAFFGCDALTELVVPEGVHTIGISAFSNCPHLRSAVFPESLNDIGEEAFMGCSELTAVTIPAGMLNIGSGAFYGCSALRSVTVSSCPVEIGLNAFSYCSNLEGFTVDPANPKYSADENGILYNKDRTELLIYPGRGNGDVVIPSGVTAIGDCAFSGRYGVRSVTIPEGVISIGESAFISCLKLRSVTIPGSMRSIGASAFLGCTSLTAFYTAPENTAYSSDEQGILFNGDKTVLLAYPCGKSGPYEIPESVVSIEDSAFYDCKGLSAVSFPEQLRSIGAYAFFCCENLSEIDLPEGVCSIDEGAFSDCYALRTAMIPADVTAIGDDAFFDCPDLTIRGAAGSEAERYANENGIPFEAAP